MQVLQRASKVLVVAAVLQTVVQVAEVVQVVVVVNHKDQVLLVKEHPVKETMVVMLHRVLAAAEVAAVVLVQLAPTQVQAAVRVEQEQVHLYLE
jgi:hypothetical protein